MQGLGFRVWGLSPPLRTTGLYRSCRRRLPPSWRIEWKKQEDNDPETGVSMGTSQNQGYQYWGPFRKEGLRGGAPTLGNRHMGLVGVMTRNVEG